MKNQPIALPLKGVNHGVAVTYTSEYYSPDMNNIRPIDSLEKRVRLGKRPGLKKWGAGTLIGSAEEPIVAICAVSSVR